MTDDDPARAEQAARRRLTIELAELEVALIYFLEGEVSAGLLPALKLPLRLGAENLLAITAKARRDIIKANLIGGAP
jgi:hypothetical protein